MKTTDLIKKYIPPEKQKEAEKSLLEGQPLQYIIGNVDFYGREFIVNKNVLIPRFETETLIEKTIKRIKKLNFEQISIVDLGTGSGCIGITLDKELECNVLCLDISEEALLVAEENKNKLRSKVVIEKHDILKKISGNFDVIISNPPYISVNGSIEKVVKNNEPHIALFAEDNGLIFYKKIIEYSKEIVNKKFLIAFEIGYDQGEQIKSIAQNYYPTAKVSLEKDLCDKDRYIFISSE